MVPHPVNEAAPPFEMEDLHGHLISYLRVSITDRCNERCHYCMPEEEQDWLAREEVLSYEEILRTVRVAASLGVKKVRVTGGEPLTRRNMLWFIDQLCAIDGINDVGISTNGTLLGKMTKDGRTYAQALKEAGVRSVNISLDTLNRKAYQRTTGRDLLDAAVGGIDATREATIDKIKINTVLMRNRNENDLWDLVDFAHERDLLLRFIELMPVSTTEVLEDNQFFTVNDARKLLEFRLGELSFRPDFRTNGPARYYERKNGQLIGFIGAMSDFHFCETCNKLRLTCEGKLRPCLGSHMEFDLREVLRNPKMTDADIAGFFHEVVARKPKEHDFRNAYEPGRKMIAIGG